VKERRPMLMKFIIHSLHDLNIAQTLNFLGYYRKNGFSSKPIDFLASIRFEMVQRVGRDQDIRLKVIYDD
jgi:hypothetical protein